MSKDWLHGEVLRAVFPLLDGKELASCMLVCRQWREIAGEDYFWKCICVKRWPSICKRPVRSYYKFFLKTFSRPQRPQPRLPTFSRPQFPQPLLPPRLSLTDLEFYIDIWSDVWSRKPKLIFSEAISGSVFQTGIKNPPAGIHDILRLHLDGPDYKMIVPVEPRLTIALARMISVSVLASRKDTNQVACIVRGSEFVSVDGSFTKALAFAYPNFSPRYPFSYEICVSLLCMADCNAYAADVFGIEIGFVRAAKKEDEVLWLLDMLDWE